MRFLDLIFGRTGTYDSMYHHPYQMGTNDVSAILKLAEATRYGQSFTENNLASFAGSILKPKAQHEGEALIANGWGTERLQFVLKVDISPMGDMSLIELVNGYSDYHGVSNLTGLKACLNPEMKFYINSTLQFRRQYRMVNGIRQPVMTLVDSSQVISGAFNPTLTNVGGGQITCRPEDVFSQMQVGMADWGGAHVVNTGLGFVEPIKKSRVANIHAPSYFTSLMSNYRNALQRTDHNSNMDSILENARELAQDGTIGNDHFLNYIRQMSGDRHRSYITWGELLRMDHTLDVRSKMATTAGSVRRDDRYYAGAGQVWSGADPVTHAANVLANSLASLLLSCGLSSASFTASNMVTTNMMQGIGGVHGEFMDGFTFHSLDGRTVIEGGEAFPLVNNVLRPRLIRETLLPMTGYGNIPLDVSVHADITSEIRITISIGDSVPTPYCMPAFAGSLYSPIVTTDQFLPTNIGKCVDSLMTEITSVAAQHNPLVGV